MSIGYEWSEVRGSLNESGHFERIIGSPWHSDAVYDRFSDQEYQRRHAAARELMRRDGLDALLLTGSPSISSGGGAVTWASGLIDGRGTVQYVLLPLEGDPLLVYPHTGSHLEAVRRMSFVTDLRPPDGSIGRTLAGRLTELGLLDARVGVTATDRGQEYMGLQTYRELLAELPDLELVFCPDLLHELTYLKSAEELAAMQRAGALAARALEAVARAARPGTHEYELAAAATHEMLAGGGGVALCMIGSTSMSDPQMVYPNPNPSARRLQAGDVVLGELSASYMGYSAKIGHPVTVGPPTDYVADFYRKTVGIFREVAAAVVPGASLEEVHAATAAFAKAGLQARPLVAHGIDLITAEPRVLMERVSAGAFDGKLVPGMVVNVTITPISPEGTFGLFLSRTYAIGESGVTCLTPYPEDGLIVAGG